MNATPPTRLEEITSSINDDLVQVERVLREGVRSVAPLIPEMGEHTFAGGGKRIRPALVLLSARLCGYRGPRAIQVAAAAEHLHSATLIHDDVVDGAGIRRGRPTVGARFGSRLAILAGDFLYAVSSQMFVDDGNADILSIFANSIRSMAEGEVLQLSRSFDPEVSESVYLDVIGRKTATLIAACAEAGAILGGVTRSERRALRDYGWELGLAFQLVDDALDYVSTGQELGKAPLADAAEGKVTLPLIVALKRCSVAERETVVSALKGFSQLDASLDDPARQRDLAHIAECVSRNHGAELALERARACTRAARAKVEPFLDCDARRDLIALADFVVQRRN